MKPAVLGLVMVFASAACSSAPDRPGAIRASAPSPSTLGTATSSPRPSAQSSASPESDRSLPAPGRPIPRAPARLAEALTTTTHDLGSAIATWIREGDPSRGQAPDDVVLLALYQQRMYRFLARHRALADRTLPLLTGGLRLQALANVHAAHELFSIVRPISRPSGFRTGPPRPAGLLLRWFRQGEERFHVDWELLAAVMYVESKFGRVRSTSTAGAQGPMQFLPSTWRTYGLGGNVHDPRDAILGAANYLHHSGSPAHDRRALFAYNHSVAYVDAVLRYANQIRRDARAYFAYYSWQVFVLTTTGDRRLTGPGL